MFCFSNNLTVLPDLKTFHLKVLVSKITHERKRWLQLDEIVNVYELLLYQSTEIINGKSEGIYGGSDMGFTIDIIRQVRKVTNSLTMVV